MFARFWSFVDFLTVFLIFPFYKTKKKEPLFNQTFKPLLDQLKTRNLLSDQAVGRLNLFEINQNIY